MVHDIPVTTQPDETEGTHEHTGLNLPRAGQPPAHPVIDLSAPSPTPDTRPPRSAPPAGASTLRGGPRTLEQENEELRNRIAALEAHKEATQIRQAFVSDEEFAALRAGAGALKEHEERRPIVPEIVPGWEADPLTHGVPPKVIRAFRQFEYVPYVALTLTARVKADNGEHELELRTDGTFAVKKFDRQNERAIGPTQWQAAAKLATELARQYWPQSETRANALAKHHDHVIELANSHSWRVALDYDIRQREIMHRIPQHDIAKFSAAVLSVVATRNTSEPSTPRHSGHFVASSPSLKRSAPIDYSASASPQKRPRVERGCCFRCGVEGHFPADCSADKTTAGKTAPILIAGKKGRYSLEMADGKSFCFSFAKRGTCSFGDSCRNLHICSICRERGHGASSCHFRRGPAQSGNAAVSGGD